MVIELVFGQTPFVVYVIEYKPNELADKLIVPDIESIERPEGEEENVPPVSPEIKGVGFAPDWQ